eukprot:2336073-Rhodomonas_salina.1
MELRVHELRRVLLREALARFKGRTDAVEVPSVVAEVLTQLPVVGTVEARQERSLELVQGSGVRARHEQVIDVGTDDEL